jgi:tetratricopeptide (TPR) repeat protein
MAFFIGFVLSINTSAQTNLAQTYFEKGTELVQTNNYVEAIDQYRTSLRLIESDQIKKQHTLKSIIHYNIGICFYKLENFKEAESELLQSVKLSENKYEKAIYALGLSQIELGMLTDATNSFIKVIKLNEKNSEAWFDLAMALLDQKQYRIAEKAFRQSIKYKSTRIAEAQNNIGVIYAFMGDINLAILHFENALLISGGKLVVAKSNLEFCKHYENINSKLLLANLSIKRGRKLKNG